GMAVESTGAEGFGGFAGLYPLDERRLLAASTDGVGSKLVLSRRAGRLHDAGRDLAAHCIDDVITSGAEPLFFLDYVAAHRLDLEQIAELVEGCAEVCREAGCALIGGETAELPGVYREEELDFAGTCVGLVERDRLIDGSRCEPGDLVLGFPSSGLHTNGFSLVRELVGDRDFDADLLLAPHRLYLDGVRALERAGQAGITTAVFELDDYPDRDSRDAAMAEWLAGRSVDLVVCAGYMHLLRRSFLERFPGRVINTHSAPLPAFPGPHPIHDVLAAGVPETAATIHYGDGG